MTHQQETADSAEAEARRDSNGEGIWDVKEKKKALFCDQNDVIETRRGKRLGIGDFGKNEQ